MAHPSEARPSESVAFRLHSSLVQLETGTDAAAGDRRHDAVEREEVRVFEFAAQEKLDVRAMSMPAPVVYP